MTTSSGPDGFSGEKTGKLTTDEYERLMRIHHLFKIIGAKMFTAANTDNPDQAEESSEEAVRRRNEIYEIVDDGIEEVREALQAELRQKQS